MRPNGWANFIYKVFDLILVGLLWFGFYHWLHDHSSEQHSYLLWISFGTVPFFWYLINQLSGQYRNVYRLSRWSIVLSSFVSSVILLIFILASIFLIDHSLFKNISPSVSKQYFFYQFISTEIFRLVILSIASFRLKEGTVGFNTIIIGGDQKAVELYNEIKSYNYSLGHKFIGYIYSNGSSETDLRQYIPQLGNLENLREVIIQYQIEEVIIAIESTEHEKLKSILDVLFEFENKIIIRTIPDTYDILLGSVKMNYLYGAVLIELRKDIMPAWQLMIKRGMDVIVSLVVIILLFPIIVFIYFRTKIANKGKAIYSQERIGLHGKGFDIYKFQSMIDEAEVDGPQLSSDSDARVTQWGRFMRKWRLDEIPQFFNVLKGEMSLVGPRPERKFFIDQIIKVAPHYKHLLKVRPGITSWGQVKFGYASNINEMIQRLKYDILYVENMSLGLDFKIMFYTVLVLIQGKGK